MNFRNFCYFCPDYGALYRSDAPQHLVARFLQTLNELNVFAKQIKEFSPYYIKRLFNY